MHDFGTHLEHRVEFLILGDQLSDLAGPHGLRLRTDSEFIHQFPVCFGLLIGLLSLRTSLDLTLQPGLQGAPLIAFKLLHPSLPRCDEFRMSCSVSLTDGLVKLLGIDDEIILEGLGIVC